MDKNVIKSVIFGVVAADALGVPVEFLSREELDVDPVTGMRGYGTYHMPKGSWSDDTSMTLCALDSLAKGNMDLDDIMTNFGKWKYSGAYTPTGVLFDIGNACRTAIDNYFVRYMDIYHCGLDSEMSNGNGSLMRITPFVLYSMSVFSNDFNKLMEIVTAGSSITHAHIISVTACRLYSSILAAIIECPDKSSIKEGIDEFRKWNPDIEPNCFCRVDCDILKNLERDEIKSSGYVVDTLEAALWCLLTTESYKECVLKAVNLGEDTDTVAAVAGGLAGALYGIDNIPAEWLEVLLKKDFIEELCQNAYSNWAAET